MGCTNECVSTGGRWAVLNECVSTGGRWAVLMSMSVLEGDGLY